MLRHHHITTPDDSNHHHHHPALAAALLVRERDHFTDAEVTALLSLPHLSVRDRLILHIMAETGLRRRAVAWLTVDGVYDAVSNTARDVAHATEKGLVVRDFMLSDGTKALLKEHIVDHSHEHDRQSPWLFPSPKDPRLPLTPETIDPVASSHVRIIIVDC